MSQIIEIPTDLVNFELPQAVQERLVIQKLKVYLEGD
ncbi:hypothetical protein GLO73106DRAFT_00005370 [Gloeocapsa sp. PCC 73106]|nr:hypothetical protein GLO73106DRAFT_00005370 [Gloeocapsa sp. PCC 73106]